MLAIAKEAYIPYIPITYVRTWEYTEGLGPNLYLIANLLLSSS